MSGFFSLLHFSIKVGTWKSEAVRPREKQIGAVMGLAARFAVSRDLHIIIEIRELEMVALSQSLSSSPACAGRDSEKQHLIHRVLISSPYCLLTTKQRLSS